MKRSLPAMVLLLLMCLMSSAPAAEPQFRRMPWHLVDLWWDIGQSGAFSNLSVDVEIVGDPPPGTRLYIAPVGRAELSGQMFYGGIQTAIDGYTRENQRLQVLGRGFLFSMWDERSLDAIRPSQGGYLQSSGHEGDFVSVRRPYEWKPGKYTVSYIRLDAEQVDDQWRTWVGSFVRRHETNETIFVGALRFSGAELTLGDKFASFVELYGRAVPVEEIPRMTITFSNPRVNGKSVAPARVSAVYPDGVPDYADAREAQAQIVIELGLPVERQQRRTVLIEQ